MWYIRLKVFFGQHWFVGVSERTEMSDDDSGVRMNVNWIKCVLDSGIMTIQLEMDFMTLIPLDVTMDLLQEIMVWLQIFLVSE